MYAAPRFSTMQLVLWTRYDILKFIFIALVPVIIFEVFNLKWVHLPWLPIALIGTAVAFVLSFQNNAAYGRIWEARKIWGGIVNSSRSWAIMVNDFVTNEYTTIEITQDEIKQIKKDLIYRHLAWITCLRYAMRAIKPWEQFVRLRANRVWVERCEISEFDSPLEEELRPYLSNVDYDYILGKSNNSTHCLSRQSKQLKNLKRKGLIDDFRHLEMEKMLVEHYSLQGKSERIKNFPYPRQYTTLNTNFVWIFLILLPFGIIHDFEQMGESLIESHQFIGSHFVWLTIPFSIIVSWIFNTLERIGRASENPFEGTPMDVPITTISRAIEIDLREMLDEPAKDIPKPMEPTFGGIYM